jgi:hypothetical protein
MGLSNDAKPIDTKLNPASVYHVAGIRPERELF